MLYTACALDRLTGRGYTKQGIKLKLLNASPALDSILVT